MPQAATEDEGRGRGGGDTMTNRTGRESSTRTPRHTPGCSQQLLQLRGRAKQRLLLQRHRNKTHKAERGPADLTACL